MSAIAKEDVKKFPIETVFGVSVVSILAVMLLPMPSFFLDLLLSLSISLSLVIFLFSLHIEKPLEFSAFPSILLLTTLLRLSLNVASTRLILMHGSEGVQAAGHVIEAFGKFVVGGNVVVGIVIFLILVVINFVVITKGAGRIAEVAARFTLDSMPGKQMAIDADLTAGLCTESEARDRRSAIDKEADFYGSMDGAAKFVRGDAVAGLMITGVNIVGGLVVGVLQQNMQAVNALKTYTSLTVGDGLVAQIPALMTSIAAGLVTTRASAGGPLAATVAQQLFGTKRTLSIASGILGLIGLVPGMPHLAFIILAAVLFIASKNITDISAVKPVVEATNKKSPEVERAEVESLLPIDLLEIEVGYELVPLVDTQRDGSLITRITGVRKQLAQDLGIVVPPIHMRDNLRLKPGEYRVLLSGNVIGKGELRIGKLMAINPGGVSSNIPGEDVVEPAFSLQARWIAQADRQRAELLGYTIVDPPSVVATHLRELLNNYAYELIGRREVQDLLDLHGRLHAKVIEDLIPTHLTVTQLTKVLKNLLREKISIRDFRNIMESLADNVSDNKDTDYLTEQVRGRLAKQLTKKYAGDDGQISGWVLSPSVEGTFRRMQQVGVGGSLEPGEIQSLTKDFEHIFKTPSKDSNIPVILTSSDIRRSVALFVQRVIPGIAVLSFKEIDPKATIRTLGVINRSAHNNEPQGLLHAV